MKFENSCNQEEKIIKILNPLSHDQLKHEGVKAEYVAQQRICGINMLKAERKDREQ
uniref:Uncharacterized protein n=1 Tax=Moniliophthora roreri TaxID=221103 RepID=A0A0W0G1S3_MONRR